MGNLRAEPITIRQAEESAKPQIRIGGDRAFTSDNLADSLRRDGDLPGQL
jgi:hypothetical protein